MRSNIIFFSLVFLLAISLLITAKAKGDIFRIQGKNISFYTENDKIRLSQNCKKSNQCMALIQSQKIKKMSLSRRERYRGPHPGAIICEKELKGKVVIGANQIGMTSFCIFKDQSLLDNGSILYLATHK